MEKKRRVLIYSDNPKMSSGCAQIWDNLLPRFVKYKPDWEFYCVGWQNHDRPHKTVEGYAMLPCDPRTPYSFHNVVNNLLAYQPDFLITTADIGTQSGYIDFVAEAKRKGWKGLWIAYSYIDTHTWERLFWDKILDAPDINLVMADHGLTMFKAHNVPNLKMIKAGVDIKTYRPLDTREELRKASKLNDKFMIGFVGRNQRRKNLPNLIKAFAIFALGKPDVGLLLHTEENANNGWDVNCLIEKFTEIDPNLRPKVRLTKEHFDNPLRQLIQPTSMNEIFNLMDYECHAVGGEGFGLPVLEAQASGTPAIMTDYSTGPELTRILIPVLKDEYGRIIQEVGPNGIENATPNDFALAKIFEDLYIDWKAGGIKLKERRLEARKFAEAYDWDLRIKEWFDLFEKHLE